MYYERMSIKNTAAGLICIISLVIVLIYAKNLLIPFVFAILLWFIIRKLKQGLNHILVIKKYVPEWIKNIIATIIVLAVLKFISSVILTSIGTLTRSYTLYQTNINAIILQLNATLNLDILQIAKEYSSGINFGGILSAIFNSITGIFNQSLMILLYTLFIFIEENFFQVKLKAIFNQEKQYKQVKTILKKIESSMSHYLGLKTCVSAITAGLSYATLLVIGIDSPEFWAFLIFIFNFIPTIGSLLGTAFPAIFALLQFGAFIPCLIILASIGVIQLLIGNVLEPKLMGNSLNISSLFAIISLSFWGVIWGITGMILSIPIAVIIIILCSQFNKTKSLAILLSQKGNIS